MERQLWLDQLAEFLVEANKNTWASGNNEVHPERKGFKEFEYKKGDFRLRDSYTGYYSAPGMSTVYFKERPAWTMCYGGIGMVEGCEDDTLATFEFLKKALKQINKDLPIRGPARYSEGDMVYNFRLNRGRGIYEFKGEEWITYLGTPIFMQDVFGGIVKNKINHGKKRPICPWEF